MIRIAKLHSITNGNSHIVRSVLCIIISLLMLIVIEMLNAVRFVTQRENHSYNRCCYINKENVQMKLFENFKKFHILLKNLYNS
jgi:hypothetical protein